MRIEGISETTDADLVTEAVAGDPAAFAHLVRRHAPMAKRMAVFWGAGADSDDVVQEAFVKAYAALPRFHSDGEFRPWLLCIVRNETRNLFRGRTRRAAREEMARSLLDLSTNDPEMEWGSGPDRIHLDQFDGTLSWVFVKRVWSQVTPTAVGGRDAAWIADTHEIVYTDRDGTERRAAARISGPCLVWERLTGSDTATLRLEGDLSSERSVRIAESVR